MAERRTLLSQASQATEPLRAAPINTPAGAFGDARGLGSFGQSVEAAGYETGKQATRNLSELYKKADAIAGARIKSQYSVGVLEASTALTQAVEDAKSRGLRGEELTNFIKAQAAPFEASMDKSMDVLAKQYPAKFEELVTKEQRAATWAGMQNNQIESGINYTNTKNQEDSLANQVTLLNDGFYKVNTSSVATVGNALLQFQEIDTNVLLDPKNKERFRGMVRDHVANNFSALIETVAFPSALEAAFEKKVISPEHYAALKHARQVWEKAGGANPGARANFTSVLQQVETGQPVPVDRISAALAGVLPGYKTPAEKFTGAFAPLIISNTVGSFRRRLINGVNPAGKSKSVEQAFQILVRGIDNKDAHGMVMSYLEEGVAELNSGPDTPSELKDPTIQKFTQPQIAEAYAKMFSLVKEQNDLIQSGNGAKAFIQDSTVRKARDAIAGKGNADGYIEALKLKYRVNGVEDPALQDISDPVRLQEIDDLLKLNTAESLDKSVKLTQEYRNLFGAYARESMLRTSSRDDSAVSGLIALGAESGPGFNEQNMAKAESMLAMATTALAWMVLPETKELLARESVGAGQGIKLMEQRIGYNLNKDDEDFASQARSGFKFHTELSETPIGRVLMDNGNLAAVRKVFEAVFHYKRRGPSIGGAMTDIQAANETMAFISTFYAPMLVSGANNPNPSWRNSPDNITGRVDIWQSLKYKPVKSALDSDENSKRISRAVDGAIWAELGNPTTVGGSLQRELHMNWATVFGGIHWGEPARSSHFPNLSSVFLFQSLRAQRAGVGLFKTNGMDMTKARVRVNGVYVPLSGPGSESLRFSDQVSAAYKEYMEKTSEANRSTTIIAQNYTMRYDARAKSFLFYLRPDTLVEGAGDASIPALVYVPDKFDNMVPLSLPLASVTSYADQMLAFSAWQGYDGAPEDIQNAIIKEKLLRSTLAIQPK